MNPIRSFLILLLLWTASGVCVSGQAPPNPPPEPPQPRASDALEKILGQAYQEGQTGRPEEELKLADQALAAARDAKDLPGEGWAHQMRAYGLEGLGRLDEASAAWTKAAEIWKQIGAIPEEFNAIGESGLHLLKSDPAAAEKRFSQSLQIASAPNNRPLETARLLMDLGFRCRTQNNLEWTRRFFEQAARLGEKIAPDSEPLAGNWSAVAGVAEQQGDLAAAAKYYEAAFDIWQNLAPYSENAAQCLKGLARVAQQRSDLASASEEYNRALVIEKNLDPASRDIAQTYDGLGDVALQQGSVKAAAQYYEQAEHIQDRIAPDSVDLSQTLGGLGNIASFNNDNKAAEQYLRRARIIQEKLAPNSLMLASTYTNLADVALHEGFLDDAEGYYKAALKIKEEKAPNSLTVSFTLLGLGDLASRRKNLKEANDYYARAHDIRHKLVPGSSSEAETLQALANVILADPHGNWQDAAKNYRAALEIEQKLTPNSISIAAILDDLSQVAEKSGDLTEAERYEKNAWDVIRHQASEVSGDEARQTFGTSMGYYASRLLRFQVAHKEFDSAFTTLEESRAQALERLLTERQGMMGVLGGDEWAAHQDVLAKLHQAEADLQKASVARSVAQGALRSLEDSKAPSDAIAKAQKEFDAKTDDIERAQKAYVKAHSEADQLWATMQQNSPRAFVSPLALDQVRTALAPGVVFVSFSLNASKSFAFVVQGGGSSAILAQELQLQEPSGSTSGKNPSQITLLQKQVRAFREQITSPGSDLGEIAASGRALFAALFPGAEGKIVLAAQHLVISPDGPLWELPFAALVTNPDGPPNYLGAAVPISYAPSLALYEQSMDQPPRLARGQNPAALIVGDPLFSRRASDPADAERTHGVWAGIFTPDNPPRPLPGTRREAKDVAALYSAEPLLGDAATESNVRRQIESADVIHLATHGYLDPVLAMSSGVLLSPPPPGPGSGGTDDDGILQAWEIFSQLKLRAEIVVLSGCDTGRGQNVEDEGIVGLTRSLMYAGARSVIASQWRVGDESTSRLMTELHKNLRAGMPKDVALQKAMEVVRGNSLTASPFYWAPFTLTGDPANPNLGSTKNK